MIDIHQILTGMVTAIQSGAFPNDNEIASALGLDLSAATTTTTKGGAIAITGARFAAQPTAEIGIAGASMPRKTLDFVFFNPDIPVAPYIKTGSIDEKRIERSKHGEGLSIALRVNGIDCGLTATGPEGVIQTLYCIA
jgi:hypothetical protein